MANMKINNLPTGDDLWSDFNEIKRDQERRNLKIMYTIENIVEIYGMENIENYIRKKKIERITNGINKQ